MKHSRSKNAVLLMIIFICSICLNNVWARETGTMDQLEKENPDDVDKMNKVLYYYNTSDCRQSPAFAGFCYCWSRFSDIINIRRAVFFYDDQKRR